MRSPIPVANYFLKKGRKENIPITPMKLVKLVYIAHGWSLAILRKELFSEDIQAWKYGPVIQSLYYITKQFGNQPIDVLFPEYEEVGEELSRQDTELLDKVWDVYKKYTAVQLSSLTHQEGTPWYTVWYDRGGQNQYGAIIPTSLIKQHYLEKTKRNNG